MAERYDHDQVELKWQKIWEDAHCFEAKDDYSMPKFYPLREFPYPSGHGLHVGHPRSNTALDIIARKRRMEGYNVLYPIGWDAFGLPTENYAIKTGIHPAKVTHDNIEHFRAQLKRLGFSFDWTPRGQHHRIPVLLQMDPVDISSSSFENAAWPTRRRCPSTPCTAWKVVPGQRGGRGRRSASAAAA